MKSKGLWFGMAFVAMVAAGCDSTDTEVPAHVTLNAASTTVAVGDTVRVSSVVQDASYKELSDEAVSYATSDAGLASVDGNGLVTALAVGTVTITGTSGSAQGTLALTIAAPATDTTTVTLSTDGATDPAGG